MPKITLMVFNITPNSKGAYILTALSAGRMGAALILFYFLHANLIEGVFPPKFTEATPMLDEKNLAILVVWMFLAGFTEKLVPNLLKRTEQRLKDS